jgi:hypothetical protein
MACASTCRTQSHASYGECLRDKGIAVYGLESTGADFTKQKKWDRELDRARGIMSQGIMPRNTFGAALDEAERKSDAMQAPFRADA